MPKTELTPEEADMVKRTKSIFAKHDAVEEGIEKIERRVRQGGLQEDGSMILLTGITGVGKSALLGELCRRNPPFQSTTETFHPFVYTKVFSPATPKSFLHGVLRGARVPTTPSMGLARLHELWVDNLKSRNVECLIVDEGQHLFERSKGLFIAPVTEHYKYSLGSIRIPILFCCPEDCEDIIFSNRELKRRVELHVNLKPFDWGEDDESQAAFRLWLRAYELQLPFESPPRLSSRPWASALMAASGGLVDRVAMLTRLALFTALYDGRRTPGLADYEAAFNELAFQLVEKAIANPFTKRPLDNA